MEQVSLRRSLGLRNLVFFGLVAMAPVAGFTVYGFVNQYSNGAVVPAYLLGGLGMALTASSFATMARTAPGAGSVYGFAMLAMGRFAGFIGGWALLLDYGLITGLATLFGAIYLVGALPGVPVEPVLGLMCAAALAVNYVGLGLSSKVDLVSTCLQLACALGFCVLALWLLAGSGGGLTLRPIWPSDGKFASIVSGSSVSIIAYLGYDAVSSMAEEVKGDDPGRTVGRAILISVAAMATVFVSVSWLLSDLGAGMTIQDPANAAFEIVQAKLPVLAVPLAVIAGMALGFSGNFVAHAASSRIVFALARDGLLPSVLSRVHRRFRSPFVAVILTFLFFTSVAFAALAHFDVLSGMVSFGALVAYIFVNLSVLIYLGVANWTGDWLNHRILPGLGIAVLLYILSGINTLALELGLVWMAVGVGVYALAHVRQSRRPA